MNDWIQSLRSTWHWGDGVDWTPAGSGPPEFTELWFSPFGLENRQPAFMARCGFATGMVEGSNATHVPSIQAAFDVMFNVQKLGPNRRPTQDGDYRGDSLAPSAFSLFEVADAVRHLFDFVAITASAAETLLPEPQPPIARVGVWVSVSGGLAERVIDLGAFRRIPRSTGMSQAFDGFEIDTSSQPTKQAVDEFIAKLLYEGLERGGYRDLDATIARIREGSH